LSHHLEGGGGFQRGRSEWWSAPGVAVSMKHDRPKANKIHLRLEFFQAAIHLDPRPSGVMFRTNPHLAYTLPGGFSDPTKKLTR
jgi:hypothetical protein